MYQGHKIHGRCWRSVAHREPTSQRSEWQRTGPGLVQPPEQSFLRSRSVSSHQKQRPLQSRYGGGWKKLSAIADKIGCVRWRASRALTTMSASCNRPPRCLLPTVPHSRPSLWNLPGRTDGRCNEIITIFCSWQYSRREILRAKSPSPASTVQVEVEGRKGDTTLTGADGLYNGRSVSRQNQPHFRIV